MNHSVLAAARAEIAKIVAWYDSQRAGLSVDFLHDLEEVFAAVEANPLRFARIETIKQHDHFRRALLARFPYLVVFHVADQEVTFVAVAHTSRKPNYWKKRLG